MDNDSPNVSERLQELLDDVENTDFELLAAKKLIGHTLGGRYKITDVLGKGGMGFVYRAIHTHLNHECAIKILNSSASKSPERIARFRREAQATIALNHNHIINVTDLDYLENGKPFLVMEYCEGQDLGALLKQTGPLSLGYVLKYFRETALALDFAHQKGVVHRDIKPENLFLLDAQAPLPAHIKLLDFGIASLKQFYHQKNTKPGDTKERETHLTVEGHTPGTIAYMAPEVALEENPDHRSDVYSLAVVIYELLTLAFPVEGNNIHHFALSKCEEKPASLTKNLPFKVPDSIEKVIEKGLSRHPENRFDSAGAFAFAFAKSIEESFNELPEKWIDETLEQEIKTTLFIEPLSSELTAKIAKATQILTSEKQSAPTRRSSPANAFPQKEQKPIEHSPSSQNSEQSLHSKSSQATQVAPSLKTNQNLRTSPLPQDNKNQLSQNLPPHNVNNDPSPVPNKSAPNKRKKTLLGILAALCLLTATSIMLQNNYGKPSSQTNGQLPQTLPPHMNQPNTIPKNTSSTEANQILLDQKKTTTYLPTQTKSLPDLAHSNPAAHPKTSHASAQNTSRIKSDVTKNPTKVSTSKKQKLNHSHKAQKPPPSQKNDPKTKAIPTSSQKKSPTPQSKAAPTPSVRSLVQQGKKAYQNRNYKEAISLLRQATRGSSSHKQAWLLLGRSYEKENNLRNARQAYLRYLKLDPDSPTAKSLRDKLNRF